MNEQSYTLGEVLTNPNGERWLIVRIVKSDSLFEPEEGDLYVLTEYYLELRNTKGMAGFIIISSVKSPHEGKVSGIKALTPILYGRKDFEDGKTNAVRSESDGEGRTTIG